MIATLRVSKATWCRYTLVELLVVIVIMAILMGIGVGGLKGVLGRQGPTGAVRTIAGQLTMARSYAVSHNRLVAVLFPDTDDPGSGVTQVMANDDQKKYLYSRIRLCYVTLNNSDPDQYDFVSWIDGQPWEELPARTAAFIQTGALRVNNIDIEGTNRHVAGIVYRPSGVLHGASEAVVKVLWAFYDTKENEIIYQEGETADKGWNITINGFTGRASYAKAP